MADKNLGVIRIEELTNGGEVILTVSDDGSGMTPEKMTQLLTDRETLDGELHSLGFVFVRQTVADFGGTLTIDSELGKGTTITVHFPYLEGVTPPPRRGSLCKEYDVAPVERRATLKPLSPQDSEGTCGFDVYSDYRRSTSDYPGCIFAIGVAEDGRLEMFSHKPYERLWNMGHEDLSPMFFAATVRGRLEENEQHEPVVILKGPQSMSEYFEFKEIPSELRSEQRFVRMVHDELVRIARRLVGTGLPETFEVQVASLERFVPELNESEPFALGVLAGCPLSTES
jgi:hypothetical protein